MNQPFTYDEIFRAVRLIGSEAEAHTTAHALAAAVENASGSIDISVDTLALLSILSVDTALKVEQYRLPGRPARPRHSEIDWERRRAELKVVVDRRRE